MTALHYVHDAGVATITLDSPPQNRLGGELVAGLGAAVQDLAGRADTRVVLLRANGPDFSHGGDITAWPDQSEEQFSQLIAGGLALTNLLHDLPVPVVVAVQGFCGGGGFELALRGDIIIAAEDAVFCHTEASIGVFTFLGGVQRVAERVGRTRAVQWAITGERVDSRTALASGLVNEVVPSGEFEAAVDAWVERLKSGATLAHAAHKRLVNAWAAGGVPAADRLLADMAGKILHSEDVQRCLPAAIEALEAGRPRPAFTFSGR